MGLKDKFSLVLSRNNRLALPIMRINDGRSLSGKMTTPGKSVATNMGTTNLLMKVSASKAAT